MTTLARIRNLATITVGLLSLVLGACADTGAVESEAESFVAPESWTLEETETLNGFENISRQFTYSSDGSRSQTCAEAGEALASWAEVDLGELTERQTALGCSFSIQFIPRLQTASFSALVDINPLRVDGVPIEDPDQPGSTGRILFSLSKRK